LVPFVCCQGFTEKGVEKNWTVKYALCFTLLEHDLTLDCWHLFTSKVSRRQVIHCCACSQRAVSFSKTLSTFLLTIPESRESSKRFPYRQLYLIMYTNFCVFFLSVFLVTVVFRESVAFSLTPSSRGRRTKSSTSARAWSLQMPEVPFPKGTWYNEVNNPTARRVVYEE
jgi:hypothetical protein